MNIKTILFTILAIGLFPFISFAQQNKKYVIYGELQLPGKAFAFIEYNVNGNRIMDSVPVINGRFHFKNEIDYPRIANIYIKRKFLGKEWAWSNSFRFFIEPGVINIKSKDSLENAITLGSKVNADYNKLKLALKDVNSEWNAIVRSYSNNSVPEASSLDNQRFDHLAKLQDSIQRTFAKKHPNSLVALYALDQTSGSIPDVKPIKAIFDGFSPEVRNSIPGLAYAKKIKLWSTLTVGVSAPNFALPDTNGTMVSLHDFRGKYVLIDFWASWCAPCRAENPNVLKAYNAFKNANFTVVGISMDNRRDNWMKAIHEDGLPWNQLSDLMGSKSEISNLYDIAIIPQNYLIDPNGIIVAKNLIGEELYDKLKKLLKNPVHERPEGEELEHKFKK